ncbi:MAG: hypothetical protein ABI216_13460 [Devosia sp.]
MGLPASVLPSTIVEFLTDDDPELVRHARADAARLTGLGYQAGFAKLEEVPTSFFELAQRRIAEQVADHAKRHGLTTDQAKASISERSYAALKERLEDQARYYHLMLNFEMAGGRIFRIAPSLAERLLETRIDVSPEALRLPFRSLMLVYDDDASMAAFHTGGPFGRNPKRGAISSILFDLEVGTEPCLLAASLHTRGRRTHGMMQRSMRYGEGSLDAMLSTHWPGTPDEALRSHGRDFHRLLLNTLLYISSDGARTTPPRRDRSARDPLSRSGREFVTAGEGLVPLRPVGHGSVHAHVERTGAGSRVRQIVSGHWKYQAHGVGRAERKLLWIEPYWRGPDFAQVVNKARLVR